MMLLLAMEYGRMLVRKKCHHKEEHLGAHFTRVDVYYLKEGET